MHRLIQINVMFDDDRSGDEFLYTDVLDKVNHALEAFQNVVESNQAQGKETPPFRIPILSRDEAKPEGEIIYCKLIYGR